MIPVRAVAKRESKRDYGCKREFRCKRELLSVRLRVTPVVANVSGGDSKVRSEAACNNKELWGLQAFNWPNLFSGAPVVNAE